MEVKEQDSGVLSERGQLYARRFDRHFAAFIKRIDSNPAAELELAALLLSAHVGGGNVCLDLKRDLLVLDENGVEIIPPPPSSWIPVLRSCSTVGAPGEERPLILDPDGNLYLHRHWTYQERLAAALARRAAAPDRELDLPAAAAVLDRLFPPSAAQPDWQRVAAALAALRPLAIITGGPGTGKTTTVLRVLALLAELNHGGRMKIILAAPTGKAANRLGESLRDKIGDLPCSSEGVRAAIPLEASTLHRLLGVRTGDSIPGRNAENQLDCDVLVVDEASMIDLSMMSKIFDACPDRARIILLGDRWQLSSVEAGNVMADLCELGVNSGLDGELREKLAALCPVEPAVLSHSSGGAISAAAGLPNTVVELQHSHRFGADSAIGRLAAAINGGGTNENKSDPKLALEILGDTNEEVRWAEPRPPEANTKDKGDAEKTAQRAAYARSVREFAAKLEIELFAPHLDARDIGDALRQLGAARVLCSHRGGSAGVVNLNKLFEERLAKLGKIPANTQHYHGCPIIIIRNDDASGLCNGDTGLLWNDDDGKLKAWFPGQDSLPRSLPLSKLPPHETMYAMTIHKSQGSEFDRVTIVIPAAMSELLSCELLYTAVTRARQDIRIFARPDVIAAAVGKRVKRNSGLKSAVARLQIGKR